MKHYIDENSRIFGIQLFGQEWAYSEGYVRNAKRIYRKRERAALNRMVEELVVEELGNRRSRSYWEDKLDDLFGELQYLEACEEYDYEQHDMYGYGYNKSWYNAEYDRLFAEIDEANYQLSLFG